MSKDFDQSLEAQQELYDRGWRLGLDAGKEQRGNLTINLDFLSQADVLHPEHRILEIGCGIGSLAASLHKQGHRIVGTDISQEAIAYGRQKYPELRLEVQPAESLPYEPASFDVVLSFDLFEHIATIDRHVSEVSRVLKGRGLYLLQTPNKYSNTLFETLSHRSLKWRRYHPSLHSPGQLRRRFQQHGFATTFVKMNPINAFSRAKLTRFGWLGALITRMPFTSLPLWMQTNLYVIAQKTEVDRN